MNQARQSLEEAKTTEDDWSIDKVEKRTIEDKGREEPKVVTEEMRTPSPSHGEETEGIAKT